MRPTKNDTSNIMWLKLLGPMRFESVDMLCIIRPNNTRQGYARKRILKLAGFLFLGRV